MSEQVDENGNTYYLEEVEVDEDDDPINYEEVDEEFDDEEEDFSQILKKIKNKGDDDEDDKPKVAPARGARVDKKAAVVDDFIRNFLIKLNMKRTLDTFNTEWYELSEQGKLNEEDIGVVADIYQRNEELDESLKSLRREVTKSNTIADKARGTWDKFRKERDFHRMHHRRVVQEKNILIRDMKRLKKHYSTFEPALLAMRAKYEAAMKDKMLMKLEKDRVLTKVSALQNQIKSYEAMRMEESKSEVPQPMAVAVGGVPEKPKKKSGKAPKKTKTKRSTSNADSTLKKGDTPFPVPRSNPHLTREYTPMNFEKMSLKKTFRGHKDPISGLAIHPTKEIVATTSDDCVWKMWALPRGELIMSGQGHKDWVGSCTFHPRGHILATSSGDGTVKLWDFNQAKCSATFADHTQAVWDAAFDENGEFLCSGSMDQTARIWDVATGRCRQTLRGHVDAVNSVVFQPYSPNVCTGSGDKTVSLWDIRSGLCIQTFYGHENAVLSTTFSLQGNTIASSDSDGVIKVWDVRTVSERCTINIAETNQAINTVQFDRTGETLVAGSDLGLIHVYDVNPTAASLVTEISGPEGAVQAIALDPRGNYMLSAGSDDAFRMFS